MIPERMQAVLCDGPGTLFTGEVPVPRPATGEVVVRVAASPINPSDLRFLSGSSSGSAGPAVPGLEGSGTVVAAGRGVLPRVLLGRRVAFAAARGGAWAEYVVVSAMRCIPLRKHVSLEQASMLIVNPLTALAFFDISKRDGHRAIVNNAAASALGQMIGRLGRRVGIPVINIVRRQEQVRLLRGVGADFVLDSSDAGFLPTLRDLSSRLHATLFLDAVGGAETQSLVDAAPFGATIVVYAGLSGHPSVFHPLTIAGGDKKIVGFYLANWMAQRGVGGMLRDIWRVQRLVSTDLQTSVRARFPLAAAASALQGYADRMTGGKVLLVADPSQLPVTDASGA